MVLDPDNPSSIYSCARGARENARAVRGSITSEMWEVLNTTWLELQRMNEARLDSAGVTDFFFWVKDRSHLFRGVTVGTALRDQAFHFNRLGIFLERVGQHRAHPRRQVPRAAAQRGGRRRRGRLLPMGGGPALGQRVRVLPQGVPRRDHAAARGRAADPARRHAALAALLHERGLRHPAAAGHSAGQGGGAPGRRAARGAALRPHGAHLRHGSARVPDGLPEPDRHSWARRSTAGSSPLPPRPP